MGLSPLPALGGKVPIIPLPSKSSQPTTTPWPLSRGGFLRALPALYNDDPHPGVCKVTTLLACGLVGLIRLRIR